MTAPEIIDGADQAPSISQVSTPDADDDLLTSSYFSRREH
jgi:hypothetical protein